MKRPIKFVLFLCLFFSFTSCKNENVIKFQGGTMGTTYNISIYPNEFKVDQKKLSEEISNILGKVNWAFSTYISESEITVFNRLPVGEMVEVSPMFIELFEHAKRIHKETDGFFDPSVGPLVNLWGFGPDKKRKVPSSEDIKNAKALIGLDKVIVKNGDIPMIGKKEQVYLDFSAIAKGYAVDLIIEHLKRLKLHGAMVEIGGEVCTWKSKSEGRPWAIGIERPGKSGARQALTALKFSKNECMATSGNYRNFFKKDAKNYSHTIDPQTGRPVENPIPSVSIISYHSCMQADAYATAIEAAGAQKGKEILEKLKLNAHLIMIDPSKKGPQIQTFGNVKDLMVKR